MDNAEWLFNQAKSQAGQDLFVVAMTQGKTHGTWLEIGCGDPVRSSNTYLLEKRLEWSGTSIDKDRWDQDIITPFEEYWPDFCIAQRRPDWPEQPISVEQLINVPGLESIACYRNFIKRQITDIDSMRYEQRDWTTARPRTDFHQANALDFEYAKTPSHCDYLQIDIHPSSDNLKVLQCVMPGHRFSVLTFEHDAWDHSEESACVRDQSRLYLQSHGYQMIVSDVTVPLGHGNGIDDEPIHFEDWWIHPEHIEESVWRCYQDLHDDGRPKYYYNLLFDVEI